MQFEFLKKFFQVAYARIPKASDANERNVKNLFIFYNINNRWMKYEMIINKITWKILQLATSSIEKSKYIFLNFLPGMKSAIFYQLYLGI